MADHDHDEHHDHDHDHDLEAAREAEIRRRVALAQVRQYGDPVLRMRAHDVDTFDEELARLVERMTSLMHDGDGVGLAATQIGILKRVFVFSDGEQDRAIVNPVLSAQSDEQETESEGCLSLGSVRVPVERPVTVTIRGSDIAGQPLQLELDGLSARVVQHELDHLDGTLIIDRADATARREALAQLRPRLVLGARP